MGDLPEVTRCHLGDGISPKIIISLEYPPPSVAEQLRENVFCKFCVWGFDYQPFKIILLPCRAKLSAARILPYNCTNNVNNSTKFRSSGRWGDFNSPWKGSAPSLLESHSNSQRRPYSNDLETSLENFPFVNVNFLALLDCLFQQLLSVFFQNSH